MTSLIYDHKEVETFVKRFFMKLEDDEVYVILLNARKKHCPNELSRSEEILGRELIRHNDLDKVMRRIKKITCVDGIYADSNTLNDIPAHCLSLYCLLDPRSTLKGYADFIEDVNKMIYDSFKGESKNLDFYRRVDIKLFSAIHKNRSRRLFNVVDIDKKDEAILDEITGLLEGYISWITETHGGYHVITEKDYDANVIIHTKISGMEYVEILKEPMTPLPGTLQGGFKVKGIRKELWK